MKDAEDIVKSLIDYLTEEVAQDGGGNPISRINQAVIESNTKKGDTLLPAVSNDIIIGQRLKDWNNFKNGRLNIDVSAEGEGKPEYNTVAKIYRLEISYIIRDDNGNNVFFRALRMEGVITDVMTHYFKERTEGGFIRGLVTSSFTPESVLLGNTAYAAIRSGIVYQLTIQ